VLVKGTWYKIGPKTFDVTADCGPEAGFPVAEPNVVLDIEAKLRALGKDLEKPCG
jgi:hypothetical protein